ncbi:MAG: Rne/Rng family ribonuclease [Terriglobia bacterium]
MTKELLIASSPHETKVAVLEDDQVVEVYFQRDTDVGLAGGIYKGRVNRVLPGMQSAFVDIGLEKDAFLYVSDFFEDSEEYDRVFTEAEDRVARMTDAVHRAPAAVVPPGTPAQDGTLPPSPSRENASSEADAEQPSVAGEAANLSKPEDGVAGETARDFPGRRRRRGRRFRTGRFTPRHELAEHHETAASHPLELLPGESLAKYSQPASPGNSPDAESTEPDLTGVENSEPISPTPASEMAGDLATGSSPDDEPVGEVLESSAPLENFADGTGNLPEGEPESLPASSVTGPEAADNEADLTDETPEGTSVASEEGAEGAAKAGDQIATPTGAAEQSYTLRDSHRRPHLAPRRDRRGRGKFRVHQNQRPEAGAHNHSSNHPPTPINELLKEGQEILVQIAKEPLGTKGARITSHIALPGRYLVYMPTIDHMGVSRKIASDEERLRLRKILLENRGSLGGGFIVRTAGAGRSEEEIKSDLAFLSSLWNDIRAKAERVKAPALLHGDLTLVERILRDLLSPQFKSIRVDNEIQYEQVLEFVNRFQPALTGHVKFYTREAPLFEEFGVQAEIDKALRPKVWLKSGGYIVINQTEALVAIDVNTGKYVGKTNRLEDTIVKINIDAIREIVRQVRLRDLGGIIVIDFIDMDERRNRTRVVQALEEALRQDRAPTKILSFNEFGLVALTRKRVKQSLERTVCEPCPYCSGAGWIKSVATVSNEILSEARKMASQVEGKTLHLRVNPQVAAALKSALISEIEASTGREIVIKGDPEVHQEQFEIF